MENDARYTVLTYDPELGKYTPQEGLTVPSSNVDIHGLRRCLRELQSFGYPCDRVRDPSGGYDSDPSVFVSRVGPAPSRG